MRKTKLMIAVMLLAWGSVSAQNWKPEEVKTIIANVNNSWQKRHPANRDRAFWDPAVYHTGTMEAYFLFNESADEKERKTADRWRKYSKQWGERNFFQGASEIDPAKWRYKNYGEGSQYVLFGDWQICFQTYIDLYNDALTKKSYNPRYIHRPKEVMSYEKRSKANDYWWWADALYMVMPVMTKMYLLTGDEGYLDKMYENWKYCNSIMYDKETGLYFRDGKYVYPKHKTANGKKDFWARGDGWVMAAFAKVLKDLPKDYKHRQEFIQYYQKLAAAIVACQQGEGYWTRSLLDPEQAPGRETSGTALNCYGLLWGINNGILPKTYLPAAKKAWEYLATIALQKNNTVGYVQPIGEKAIPGQVVDLESVTNFGTGAFLLAACEYYRTITK